MVALVVVVVAKTEAVTLLEIRPRHKGIPSTAPTSRRLGEVGAVRGVTQFVL